VTPEVSAPTLHRRHILNAEVLLTHPPVHLEGADRRHEHHCRRREPPLTTLDVHKLLSPQIRPKPRLSDHELRERQGGAGGDEAVTAVGDVGEGPPMDQGGGALKGLDEVGERGVFKEGRHRPISAQLPTGDRLPSARVRHHHITEAPPQIL